MMMLYRHSLMAVHTVNVVGMSAPYSGGECNTKMPTVSSTVYSGSIKSISG